MSDELFKQISERLQAIDQNVSGERLNQIVREQLSLLLDDPEFARKMRFGQPSDERKLVGTKYARFGLTVDDVEWLYDFQRALQGKAKRSGGVYEGPSEMLENTFRAISEARYLSMKQVREMDRRAIDDAFPRIPLSMFEGEDRELAARGDYELTGAYKRAIRAMDTAESGYGSQLVGAQYVGDLWEAARRDSRVFALLQTFEMTAPTAYLPVEADIPEMLLVSESTANNSSNYATVKSGSNRVQVDAKKFVMHQMWSGEMEEDSILPFVPFIRAQAAKGLAHYSDSVVLNGDTTNAATGNINLDDANPADTKHYLAFDGIRHVGLVDNTNNGEDLSGAITFAALMKARGRMIDTANLMDWGHPTMPDDLVYVTDPETADTIAQLDEMITVDKFGPNATVLTGQVARVGGHPLIGSMAMSKTEADGKVSTTGGNNTKGQVVTFNRNGFAVGWRRRVMLETERLPASDQWRIVHSLRIGLGRYSASGAASGIEAADVIYNISI